MKRVSWRLWTAALVVLLVEPVLGVGGHFTTSTKSWCDMTQAERDCICMWLPCFPADVQKAINDWKGVAGGAGKPWKSPGKICRGTPKPPGGKDRARTDWDPATGKLTGIAFFGPFFTDGVWKKLAVRQEGNRVTYGGFYPLPNAKAVLGGGGTKAERCLALAYAEVNNGLTNARDTASRSTFPSMAKPAGVTQAAWDKRMCQEMKDAATKLATAKWHKRRAKAANAAKNGGAGDANVNKAIAHLCWEIKNAEAALKAAEKPWKK